MSPIKTVWKAHCLQKSRNHGPYQAMDAADSGGGELQATMGEGEGTRTTAEVAAACAATNLEFRK